MAKPISETLKMFQGGDFNIKAGELFASVLRGVEDTGKAGKLTITLDVKQQNGAVSVLAKVTDKTPEALPDADLYWTTPDGNLSLRNPAQRDLDLRQIELGFRFVQRGRRRDEIVLSLHVVRTLAQQGDALHLAANRAEFLLHTGLELGIIHV